MNKIIISKEGDWNCFLWEGILWKKIHKRLKCKELTSLYKACSLEEAGLIFFQIELKAAKALCLFWLGRRGFFHKEIEEKLRFLGVSRESIVEVLLFCERIGVIDDVKHLQVLKERAWRKGKGAQLVRMKTRHFVEDRESSVDLSAERESLIFFLQKKQINPSTLAWEQKCRLQGLLCRRGFSVALIEEVFSPQN